MSIVSCLLRRNGVVGFCGREVFGFIRFVRFVGTSCDGEAGGDNEVGILNPRNADGDFRCVAGSSVMSKTAISV